jgi:alcohol dehydrogenase
LLVPTTFGSSSEITKWATIWDWEDKKKYSISNELLYPDKALIFPELSLTASRDITAYTALDTLSHAIESIWNIHKNPVTFHHAIEAIEICIKNLPLLLDNLGSLEYRTKIAKASFFAGLAFSQTRTAAAHALSYPLTLYHEIPHGYACSLTLGAIFDFNLLIDSEDLGKVLALFRKYYGNNDSSFSECFSNFLVRCKVPMTLGEFGVSDSDVTRLVDNAFHPDRFKNMIHTLSESQVRAIYNETL